MKYLNALISNLVWPQVTKQARKPASKHTPTHVRNAVLLVWGSLRLASIKLFSELYTPTVFILSIEESLS